MVTGRPERRRTATLDAVARECARDLAPTELLGRAAERLRMAVACDADGWMLLDPQTLMFTGGIRPDRPPEALSRLMEIEFRQPDAITFRRLAHSPRPVSALWQATCGRPERSPRYRNILRPFGFGDELRAVFRSGGTCWGAVSLVRAAAGGPFSEADADLVSAAGSLIGDALRRALTSTAACCSSPADGPPGVLVLNRDDTVETRTPEAARLLRQAGQVDCEHLPLPMAVYSVAHQARAGAADRGGTSQASARVPLPSGRWLSVDAAPLDDPDGSLGRVAVVLQPARRAHLSPLMLAAKGLTIRERQVAAMLLAGDTTEHIAGRMVISRHTLRDHTKAIYAKFGVTSRPEFTALLLHEETIPHRGGTDGELARTRSEIARA